MNLYRKCSAIFLFNPNNGMYFAGERVNSPNAWQIPQGGVDRHETHLECAFRELREETGIKTVRLLRNTKYLYKYDFPEDIRKILFHKTKIDYLGQEIRFFLFEFLGDESEIDLFTTQFVEFSRWKWMRLDDILNGIINFKKDAFLKAANELILKN